MMAFKIICFAIIGAILALLLFSLFSVLISFIIGLIFGGVPPFYIMFGIPFIGIPVGIYYGANFAMRSRGYSFNDYFRSLKDFLNNT